MLKISENEPFLMIYKKRNGKRFIDIGREIVAVAAARVVEAPSRGGKSVDVYKTGAKLSIAPHSST